MGALMDLLVGMTRWVEIDLDAVTHNYRQIRNSTGRETKILGVVKADAYGLGALEVARSLEKAGVDMLGVTTVEEGRQLREAQIAAPILVFGPFLPQELPAIERENLTITVAGKEQLQWLSDYAFSRRKVKVHLKVETGMGRTGFWPQEIVAAARDVQANPGLVLEGVYSHLATAMWKDKRYARRQFDLFQKALANLEEAGINGLVRHICNSAATLDMPEMHLDMVRVGTILYGQYPSPALEGRLELRDPWAFKARVAYVRELPPGHSVGYGRTFKTHRTTRRALLPVGFTDGFQLEPVLKPVSLWEVFKGLVKLVLHYLNHPRVTPAVTFPGGCGRIAGKAGMQLVMVDVTGIPGIEAGTVAQLALRRTSVSAAVPRVYLEGAKVSGIRTNRLVTEHIRQAAE